MTQICGAIHEVVAEGGSGSIITDARVHVQASLPIKCLKIVRERQTSITAALLRRPTIIAGEPATVSSNIPNGGNMLLKRIVWAMQGWLTITMACLVRLFTFSHLSIKHWNFIASGCSHRARANANSITSPVQALSLWQMRI